MPPGDIPKGGAAGGAAGPPAMKRQRSGVEVAESSFVDELGKMDEAQPLTAEDFRKTWARPAAKKLDPARDSLVFQQLDINHYMGDPLPGMPGSTVGPIPIIEMYGVTDTGNSVMAHIHGFSPYFYCTASDDFTDEHCAEFMKTLNDNALKQLTAQHSAVKVVVLAVELQMKESIFGFHGNRKRKFLQVTVTQHAMINKCKRVLESGFNVGRLGHQVFEAYESNVEYNLRFMIDTKVVGCNWIELPQKKYRLRYPKGSPRAISSCQYEVDVAFCDFISHAAEGEYAKLAPLRILSFDIECAGRKGVFPEPEIDPVIQIANMVQIQGEPRPFVRNIFALDTCANIVGSQVLSFDDEKMLLEAWADFVRTVDCDMITGYNIMNFDIPFLIDRAKTLRCKNFAYLGRIPNRMTKLTETKFTSKAFGTRENKDINLDGRLKFDLLQVLLRDQKLRSYSLNSVSAHFLGEQKEDVHHSIITDLQNGNEQTRRRLAVYCMKDAYLPLRLMDKLMCVYNYVEMARVTGVPFSYLLTRGQQIKVVSQLLRMTKEQELVIPVYERQGGGGNEVEYEGATVIDPIRGYYDVPIATLDFASLYPSIMMAHNLCYTTLLTENERRKLQPTDYIKTPNNDYFVKPSKREGLLPLILTNLLKARAKAKKDLKKETDPFKKAVLDGRQLALKISANSVYGFTGATVGRLPCLAISSSVTAFGRLMIEQTKEFVEREYVIGKNDCSHDAIVVYGDTDSVMIKFGDEDMTEVMRKAEAAAKAITATFVSPIKLEFEKVYFPYLLINKKRYAGLYWTRPEKHDKMDTKGIVTVRRDNCRLVVTLINTCLQKLLIERNVEGAIEFAKGIISDLLCNRVDISQLVITKQLSRSAEGYDNKQAHVELAARMKKRDAGSAPAIGDRVPYVIIQGTKDQKAYEKSEDPIYVLEHSVPIDTKYYLENQLSKPLLSIFEPILGESKAKGLLSGDHTRTVVKVARANSGLMKFTKVKESCMGCKAMLRPGETNVCTACKAKEGDLYQKEMERLARLEEKFSRLWSQCQRCQGSLHQDVLCTSSDCPIYYQRKKVQKDLQLQDRAIAKFSDSW